MKFSAFIASEVEFFAGSISCLKPSSSKAVMKLCILALCLGAVVHAAPRANHGKGISMEENEIPTKRVKGVSVDFGGLRAGAGLGGSENGGALWANAEVPGASAGTGLYGGNGGNGAVASASAGPPSGGYGGNGGSGGYGGTSGSHHEKEGGFFDRIFAIPINVLHSVNTYVKSKQGQAQAHPEQGSTPVGSGPSTGASAGVGGSGYKPPPPTSDYGVASGPNAQGGDETALRFAESEPTPSKPHGHHRPSGARPDYDKIFNIPISALKSVNDFLNG